LSILAILASLLIPALTGYIKKAKKQAIIEEATDIWKTSQAAMSECYALHLESFEKSCKFTTTIDSVKMTKLGRITNGAKDGKVVAINFGKDGYMVTVIPGKETTCIYNGKSLPSS